MTGAGDLVVIGEVTRPHGLRGEVRVAPHTDRPDRFEGLDECVLWDEPSDARVVRRITRAPGNLFAYYFRNLQRKGQATRGNAFFKHDPALPDAALTDEYLVSQMLIAGTVNEVVDRLLAFREQVGPFGRLLYCGHDWAEPAAMRRSMELMAERVLPAVNRALG